MNALPLRARIALVAAIMVALCGCHRPTKTPTNQTPARISHARHVQPSDTSGLSYNTLVQRGTESLRINMEMNENTFQISQAAWNVDQDGGVIRFQSPSGLIATAPVQIIGTYNTAEGTWVWAWDNPSVHPGLAQHASALRELGEQNSLAELTTAKLTCDPEHCWSFVAAAGAMNNAQGAYRGVTGDTAVFMTFGEVQLSRGN